jgi:hypothetical protein
MKNLGNGNHIAGSSQTFANPNLRRVTPKPNMGDQDVLADDQSQMWPLAFRLGDQHLHLAVENLNDFLGVNRLTPDLARIKPGWRQPALAPTRHPHPGPANPQEPRRYRRPHQAPT